jgi:hypothetical protein
LLEQKIADRQKSSTPQKPQTGLTQILADFPNYAVEIALQCCIFNSIAEQENL